MKSYEFPRKGKMSINVKTSLDEEKILKFLESDDSDEFEYFNKDCMHIVQGDIFYNPNKLVNLVEYNGKYDGNLKGILEYATENNIDVSIICIRDEYSYPEIYENFVSRHLIEKVNEIISSDREDKAEGIIELLKKEEYLKTPD